MNVFRHHDVSVNAKLETPPHPFQRSLEHSLLRVCRKQRATMVAAERHEMTVSGLVKTLQSPWHGRSLCLHKSPLKPKTGLNGPPVLSIFAPRGALRARRLLRKRSVLSPVSIP